MQLSIHFGAAGNQIKLADIAGIQACTSNLNLPTINVITLQLALLNNRLTRGERGMGRINKTATITGDPVRVGHHHMRLFTGHLGVAFQLTGLPTSHLIKDQSRSPAVELTVTDNNAAQLGLGEFICAVIENQPLLAHVVIDKFVVR